MASAIRHSDGHLFLAVWNAFNSATADLRFFEINGESSITERTEILTNSDDSAECDILIDQNRNRIFVAYIKGTDFGTTVDIRSKFTTDAGVSWSAESILSETSADYTFVSLGVSARRGLSTRMQPVWFNDGAVSAQTNNVNSVVITSGGGNRLRGRPFRRTTITGFAA